MMSEDPGCVGSEARSTEAELLLCCARTQLEPEYTERAIALLQENIDWRELIDLARRHSVVSLLYQSLEAVGASDVPESVRDEFRRQIRTDLENSLCLTKELLHLLAVLEENAIVALPYKGPAMALSVYRDLVLRPSGDLDILVHERDILKAMEVFVACGYEVIKPSIVAEVQPDCRAELVVRLRDRSLWAYQLVLWNPERRVKVELHWRIAPKYVLSNRQAELWTEPVQVRLGGSLVPSMAPENLLWVLCVHGTKHRWEQLKWICDVAELIRAYPGLNWDQVVARAGAFGAERRLYVGVCLAHCLLGARLPKAIERESHAAPGAKRLAQDVVDAVFGGKAGVAAYGTFREPWFQIRAMDRMGDGGPYMMHLAFGRADRAKEKVLSLRRSWRRRGRALRREHVRRGA